MDKNQPQDAANLTIRVLEQIRDEVRHLRTELKGELHQLRTELTTEIRATNERIDRQDKRQTEDSIRLATEISKVAKGLGQVRDLLRDRKAERVVLTDHEKRIRAIERKIA